MRYTIYRLKSPYGDPGEIIAESDNRAEIMEKTAELIRSGETPASIRVITDDSIPEPEVELGGGYFY